MQELVPSELGTARRWKMCAFYVKLVNSTNDLYPDFTFMIYFVIYLFTSIYFDDIYYLRQMYLLYH